MMPYLEAATTNRGTAVNGGTRVAGSFLFHKNPEGDTRHEINSIIRGLGVTYKGVDLVGEGIGLSAPICLGGKTTFPLQAQDKEQSTDFVRVYRMNGVSVKKISRVELDRPYKWVKDILAPSYIHNQAFRPFYAYLMWARTGLGIKSVYTKTESLGEVNVRYRFDGAKIDVSVETQLKPGSKVMIANELSGSYFDKLRLGNGELMDGIPPWCELQTDSALLYSPHLAIGLRISCPNDSRMYAGREVVGKRLDWAGFSLLLEPKARTLRYTLEMVRGD